MTKINLGKLYKSSNGGIRCWRQKNIMMDGFEVYIAPDFQIPPEMPFLILEEYNSLLWYKILYKDQTGYICLQFGSDSLEYLVEV